MSNATLDGIQALERLMADHSTPEQFPVEHHFADGQYLRSMTIPAGGVLVGQMHAHEHLCIVATGDVTVWTAGGEALRLTGPQVLVSLPGAKRVIHAHTDTTFMTVHRNDANEADIIKLERALTLDEAALPAEIRERLEAAA